MSKTTHLEPNELSPSVNRQIEWSLRAGSGCCLGLSEFYHSSCSAKSKPTFQARTLVRKSSACTCIKRRKCKSDSRRSPGPISWGGHFVQVFIRCRDPSKRKLSTYLADLPLDLWAEARKQGIGRFHIFDSARTKRETKPSRLFRDSQLFLMLDLNKLCFDTERVRLSSGIWDFLLSFRSDQRGPSILIEAWLQSVAKKHPRNSS